MPGLAGFLEESAIARAIAWGGGLGAVWGAASGMYYGDYLPIGRTIGYGIMGAGLFGLGRAAWVGGSEAMLIRRISRASGAKYNTGEAARVAANAIKRDINKGFNGWDAIQTPAAAQRAAQAQATAAVAGPAMAKQASAATRARRAYTAPRVTSRSEGMIGRMSHAQFAAEVRNQRTRNLINEVMQRRKVARLRRHGIRLSGLAPFGGIGPAF